MYNVSENLIWVCIANGHFVTSAQSSRNAICLLLVVVDLEPIFTFCTRAFGCCSDLRSSKYYYSWFVT